MSSSSAAKHAPAIVETLCGSCGLCCNGTLFGDVRLRPREDAQNLLRRGLPLEPHGRSFRLPQPCACWQAGRCTVYPDRPQRCRTFECGVLKRTLSGEINLRGALGIVGRAARERARTEALLGQCPSDDASQPLRNRMAEAMKQPLDLSDSAATRRTARLMQAMRRLTELLDSEFLRA